MQDLESFTHNTVNKIPFDVGNIYKTTAQLDILNSYTPISLSQMKDAMLLRRIDTKYIMSKAQLIQALSKLTSDYDILDINGHRAHHYQTLYYDTPDFDFYHQHHNGNRNRYKVRTRAYVDSDTYFLEIKKKTNKEKTVKSRMQIPSICTRLGSKAFDFIHSIYREAPNTLLPTLWNDFYRITLVSKHRMERLTLDVKVKFWFGHQTGAIPGIVVAEVKQDAFSLQSEFVSQMHHLGVRALRFSKYCIGMTMIHTEIKANNFKPLWLHMRKIAKN